MALLLALATSVPAVAADVPLRVVYPRPDAGDGRYQHGIILLQAVLEKSGAAFDLHPSKQVLADYQNRFLAMLEQGTGEVTVAIAATSISREQRLRAIRIPIDKGLIGWRLALVPTDRSQTLSHIRSIDDLRRLTAGQGLGWADTGIMEANRLPVAVGDDYDDCSRCWRPTGSIIFRARRARSGPN